MAFTSRWLSAVLIAVWNVVSLILELFLYGNVYKLEEETLGNKNIEKNSSSLERKRFLNKF